jgi:hypothetical protein
MESFWDDARALAILAVAVALPQLLGYAAYRWIRNKPAIVKALTILVPPMVFFLMADLFFSYQASGIQTSGHRVCGAFAAAAIFSTEIGTIFHFLVGGILFTVYTFLGRRKRRRLSLQPS